MTEIVNQAELDEAVGNEAVTSYTHIFKNPINYNNTEITSLTFDFDKLTGNDDLAIEKELNGMGIMYVSPEFNSEYLIRLCAKACTTPITYDFFSYCKMPDYKAIKAKARSFLLRAEL
ncbi:MAG: hypothetical protein ACI4OB_07020 [Christensenellales bacterium]